MIEFSNFIAGQEIIFLILFFVIIPAIIIAVIVNVRKKSHSDVIVKDEPDDISQVQNEQNTHSLKILKERLAKGEITKEEFNKLKSEFE